MKKFMIMNSHFILEPKITHHKLLLPLLPLLLQNDDILQLSLMMMNSTHQSTPSQILLLTPNLVTIYARAVPSALVENFFIYHVQGRFVLRVIVAYYQSFTQYS
jgi:hypothetical protein